MKLEWKGDHQLSMFEGKIHWTTHLEEKKSWLTFAFKFLQSFYFGAVGLHHHCNMLQGVKYTELCRRMLGMPS